MSDSHHEMDPEANSPVDFEQEIDEAKKEADSKEQEEFYEEQVNAEDLSQGYGH